MRGKIVSLRQTSGGCPEQYEGKTAEGDDVFARERHGEWRIELNGEIIAEGSGDDAYAALAGEFEIDCEVTR